MATGRRTFVYLANGISANGAEIPYSVVAGVDPKDPLPLNPTGIEFADDEIVLANWKESPLKDKVKPGDNVTLTYFKPEVEGKVEETKHTFRLKGFHPVGGQPGYCARFPRHHRQARNQSVGPAIPLRQQADQAARRTLLA